MGKSLKEYDREEKAKKAVNAIIAAVIAYYIFKTITKPLKIKRFRILNLIFCVVPLIYTSIFVNGYHSFFVIILLITFFLDFSNFRVNPSLVPKFKIIGLSTFVLSIIGISINDALMFIALPLFLTSQYFLGLYLSANMYSLYLSDNPVGKPIKNFWTGKITTLGEPLEYERYIVVQLSIFISFFALLGNIGFLGHLFGF